jgi:hypothetical protein
MLLILFVILLLIFKREALKFLTIGVGFSSFPFSSIRFVSLHYGILLSHKERNYDICREIDKTRDQSG